MRLSERIMKTGVCDMICLSLSLSLSLSLFLALGARIDQREYRARVQPRPRHIVPHETRLPLEDPPGRGGAGGGEVDTHAHTRGSDTHVYPRVSLGKYGPCICSVSEK